MSTESGGAGAEC